MTFAIEVQNEQQYPIDETRLRAAATTVLTAHEVDADSSLTIVIADNAFIAALNRQYRQVDAPTDVLSFPADSPPVDIPGEAPYLGDLVVAYPYASAQAAREGHDLSDSLALLIVHGTLHLLGYDHDTAANKAVMWAAQETALRTLQISPAIVPALEG